MPDSYDVVIIGGGVTGSASAYFLAAQESFDGSILVIERDPTYEYAPSARATGGIRQQFSTPENVQIGLFGAHFVKHIGDYLAVDGQAPDVGFKEQGYLLLARSEMLSLMRENNAVQREYGADIHFQTPDALNKRFPWLKTEQLAGGFLGLSNEGWVDPYSLLQAFRNKARSLGVTYLAQEAAGVISNGARVEAVVLQNAERIGAGAVLNAAGAYGVKRIANSIGVELPIERRKRYAFVFDCRQSIGPAPLTILPQGIGFRPEGRGYLSNTAPPPERDPIVEDDDFEIEYDLFDEIIWPSLAEYIPAFEAVKLNRAYCCHYDFNTLDENAILGRIPEFENFYMATGFSGHGLQQSPAVGRAMSELITFGEYRTLDLSRFGYERVLSGAAVRETNCY